jgi:hypothetical protein
MAGNANLILAGVGGGGTGSSLAYFAPQGTAAPTDATTALAAAYRDAGWVTEDGLTRAVAEDSTDINAFGSGAPVRTLVTNSRVTFAMGFLESNPISLAIYHRLPLTASSPPRQVRSTSPRARTAPRSTPLSSRSLTATTTCVRSAPPSRSPTAPTCPSPPVPRSPTA